MFTRVEIARESVTVTTLTINCDAKIGNNLAERATRVGILGVETKLDESIALIVHLSTTNKRSPVSYRLCWSAPETTISSRYTGTVNVVAL
jgi:hypothetical protein